jgi:dTDP-4-amino-4,6-dideoxygalactose transaminase
MIPFLDLRAQHEPIADKITAVVSRIVRSGNFILGEHNRAFEENFAAYCGSPYAVAVNSGTSALQLALLAAGVRPGDEVITVSMTFVATVAAILYTGAVPKLVDIDPASWTMDVDQFEAAITPRTKAVIPVHLHGRLAQMSRIMDVAHAHGITVIEDAAQAHGAERNGRRAGTFGDMGCFSFYPGKNLGACGEGGAIVTDRADLAQRVGLLRDWGQETKYKHVLQGFNFRMDEIQAAILNIKLAHIEDWTEGRRRVAARYDEQLASHGIDTPRRPMGLEHVYHVYAIRVADRDEVRRRLGAAGIATGIHYPTPVHLQPAYESLGYGLNSLPVSERLATELLSLPVFPEMTDAQVDEVCRGVTESCALAEVARVAGN